MTTEVFVKNKGPQDIVVDTMGKSTKSPSDPHQMTGSTLVAVGDEQWFYVYESQYLVVRERE